jgi:hypothetical protein
MRIFLAQIRARRGAPSDAPPFDLQSRYTKIVNHVSESAEIRVRRLDPLDFELDLAEIYRYLGYPAEAANTRTLSDELTQTITRGRAMLSSRGIYAIHPIQIDNSRGARIGGTTVDGDVANFLDRAVEVAVFVVTVGEAITDCARNSTLAGDIVAAWALDALGSAATEAAADALAQHLHKEMGPECSISPRYSPGYCGMELTEQLKLFSLVDAAAIGVQLLDSMLMQPTKSVSGVLGIAPRGVFAQESTPCARCTATRCSMRR